MKDQRTPGIWQVDSAGTYVEVIEDGESVAIANCEDNTTMPTERCRANAAFIVRACNAHDELVAALTHIESLEKRADGSRGMVDNPEIKAFRAMAQIARAAIAKATA